MPAILGKCPYCEELVWSGDWEFDRYYRFSHAECVERERERLEGMRDGSRKRA
ncbi:hypothetical protein BSNK01_12250 [Bacillaceae bacterium]